VFATARSTKAVSSLEEKGIETFVLDVTSVQSITALKVEIVKRTGGKLNMLFNNAGISMCLIFLVNPPLARPELVMKGQPR
jgi:1-acylglycerone phosphate reductase